MQKFKLYLHKIFKYKKYYKLQMIIIMYYVMMRKFIKLQKKKLF